MKREIIGAPKNDTGQRIYTTGGITLNVILNYLSAAAKLDQTRSGDTIEVRVDLVIAHDGSGPSVVTEFENAGYQQVFDPKRIAIFYDHAIPAPTVAAREGHLKVKSLARRHGFHVYDKSQGVIHQMVLEDFRLPRGSIIVGADGHVATAGAYGVLAFTVKPAELAQAMATGRYRLTVPEVVAIEFTGGLRHPASAKDAVLHILSMFGTAGLKGKAVILHGSALEYATLDECLTVANMVSEAGAVTAYVAESGEDFGTPDQVYRVDAGQLEPLIACPPDPGNVKPVREVEGAPVTEVIIGACSAGRFSDLKQVAEVLRGKQVHPDVTLVVVPASRTVAGQLDAAGLSVMLRDAGAILTNPGCGPCFGAHQGVLAAGDRAVSTTTKNVPGRIGDKGAEIYLASPLVAAHAALAGKLVVPPAE